MCPMAHSRWPRVTTCWCSSGSRPAFYAVRTAHRIGIANTPTFILGRTRMNGWNYYEVIQSILEKQGLHPKSEADGAG